MILHWILEGGMCYKEFQSGNFGNLNMDCLSDKSFISTSNFLILIILQFKGECSHFRRETLRYWTKCHDVYN